MLGDWTCEGVGSHGVLYVAAPRLFRFYTFFKVSKPSEGRAILILRKKTGHMSFAQSIRLSTRRIRSRSA